MIAQIVFFFLAMRTETYSSKKINFGPCDFLYFRNRGVVQSHSHELIQVGLKMD